MRSRQLLTTLPTCSPPVHLFLHLKCQEYLAACHLAERINTRAWNRATVSLGDWEVAAKGFVDRKAWLPNWRELIILLAGKLKDAVPLLEMLSDDAKDDVFRHRLDNLLADNRLSGRGGNRRVWGTSALE